MHRKFVNKNRQKRKYTKKAEAISSFSFSKTAYGMLPLMVMFVAFMSTIVISTPFRDALTNIRFTFEPPQFSLDNPISFLQSLENNIAQLSLFTWTLMLAIYEGFVQAVFAFFGGAIHTVGVVQNGVVTQKDATFTVFNLLAQEIAKTLNSIWFYCVSTAQTIATVITNTILFIGHLVVSSITSFAQKIVFIVEYVANAVVAISLVVVHFIALIGVAIWNMLVATGIAIATTTQHIFEAIVYFIELPFKIIDAFLLQFKPYVDVIAKHIAMTGNDFSNGVASFGKVASLMGPSK